jgi:hypothetical protein
MRGLAEFAVESIRQRWNLFGKYQHAKVKIFSFMQMVGGVMEAEIEAGNSSCRI